MQRRVIFSPQAEADLDAMLHYLAFKDDAPRSSGFVRRVLTKCEQLTSMPYRGRQRPDIAPGIRSLPFRPVVIFYRVRADGDIIEIVRIIDGRRDLATVFFKG